jgi:hypothetical protein
MQYKPTYLDHSAVMCRVAEITHNRLIENDFSWKLLMNKTNYPIVDLHCRYNLFVVLSVLNNDIPLLPAIVQGGQDITSK